MNWRDPQIGREDHPTRRLLQDSERDLDRENETDASGNLRSR